MRFDEIVRIFAMAPTLFSRDRMAAAYGVSPESLRLYEGRGLLQPVTIDGAAYYTGQDRVRLEIVIKGLRLGFSLGEIATIVTGTLAATARRLPDDGLDRDRIIAELRALLARQGCPDVAFDELKALLRGD